MRATVLPHRVYRDDLITVALVNVGRVSARAPYLELRPSDPWNLWQKGIDGSRVWNIPVIAQSVQRGGRVIRLGGSLTTVIHPQTSIDVCVLRWGGPQSPMPAIVEVAYAFAAEDVPLTSGTLTLPCREGAEATS